MNDETPRSDGGSNSSQADGARLKLSNDQRRRLLRAAASSSVLAGAGVPLAAQASTRPFCKKSGYTQNYHACASAVGSIIGSVAGTDTPKYGYPCSHYTTSGNWPASCTNGRGRTISYNLCANPSYSSKMRFYVAFEFASTPSTGAATYRYCADILANYPTSDEAIWLTAMFNANKVGSAFPYVAANIIDLYESKNPQLGGLTVSGLNTKAMTLFRDYVSQGPT